LRAVRGLRSLAFMRTLAMVLWVLFGWPLAVLSARRARRRLRAYGASDRSDGRGPLTLERVA